MQYFDLTLLVTIEIFAVIQFLMRPDCYDRIMKSNLLKGIEVIVLDNELNCKRTPGMQWIICNLVVIFRSHGMECSVAESGREFNYSDADVKIAFGEKNIQIFHGNDRHYPREESYRGEIFRRDTLKSGVIQLSILLMNWMEDFAKEEISA
ncbi:MAG: hypothetical protein PHR36_02375 [Patescibacteria group bacterium]|nr:hypothetical protein [Patescibacteria group bacterium]